MPPTEEPTFLSPAASSPEGEHGQGVDAPALPAQSVTPGNDEQSREAQQLDADIASKRAELDDLERQVAEANDELDKLQAEKADAQDTSKPEPAPAVEGPDEVKRLTVEDGDSLDAVADRENVNRDELFRLNRPALEAAAQARGFAGSDDGRLLFAGTTLTLP